MLFSNCVKGFFVFKRVNSKKLGTFTVNQSEINIQNTLVALSRLVLNRYHEPVSNRGSLYNERRCEFPPVEQQLAYLKKGLRNSFAKKSCASG